MILAAFLLPAVSCSKGGNDGPDTPDKPGNPSITIATPEVILGDGVETKTALFTSSASWTAKLEPAITWCKISPVSGYSGSVTINITTESNNSYDDRSVKIKITAEGKNEYITITQKRKGSLVLMRNEYFDLPSDGKTIDVELKTNLDYEIIMPKDEWVKAIQTKALSSYSLKFEVLANDTYDARSAEIVIKDKNSSLSDTLKVRQLAKNGLMFTQKTFDIPTEGKTIDVVLKTNLEYDLILPEVNWVHQVHTKSLLTYGLQFVVDANPGYENRSTEIVVKDKNSSLSDTVKIRQVQKNALVVSQTDYTIPIEGKVIDVELKTNLDYEIVMPNVDWITEIKTRALNTYNLKFNIVANNTLKDRAEKIIIRDNASNLSDTVKIHQLGEAIKITNGIVVLKDSCTLGFLGKEVMDTITKLVIVGPLGKEDFDVMRDNMPKLKQLYLNDAKVDKIPDKAFENKKTLSEIHFPKITSIGNYAFYGCDGIGLMLIPNGLKNVGDYSFYKCSSIGGSPLLPPSVVNIGKYAFYGCSQVEGSIDLPNVKNIGEYAFYGCSMLSGDLIIPEGVECIGEGTFQGCGRLNGLLVLPNSVTNIGVNAFYDCSKLTGSLNLSKVKYLGKYAFYNCEKLSGDLKLSNEIKEIGDRTFYKCNFSGDLIIPEGVSKIGRSAFESAFRGTLQLPYGLTSIGDRAFYDCGLQGSLNLSSGLNYIGEYAFFQCSNLTGDLDIPEGVRAIGKYAFYGCRSLQGTLTISKGVISIGEYAFYGCSNLSGDLIIPSGLTSIGEYAFSRCYSFEKLSIPNSVVKIGKRAFDGCAFSGDLIIPNQLKQIEEGVFFGCFGFKHLIIPECITSIGKYAFSECSGFNGDLILPKNITYIGDGAFYNCPFQQFKVKAHVPLNISYNGNSDAIFSSYRKMLLVPKGCAQIYKNSTWGQYFTSIVEDSSL